MLPQLFEKESQMKLLQTALVAAWVLLPVSAAVAGSIPPDARKTIDAENAKWVPSLKAGDVKQACSGFAADALVVSADGKASSIDEYEAALQKRFDAGLKITGGQVISNGAELVNGQIVEWGSSILTAKDKDGPEHKGGGYYLAVWTKNKDGVWQITRNISLGNPQN
jgi:ketosteroid isomerase-like protein